MLPKWIDEYHKCVRLPHRRENRAAVAISTIETDKRAGDAVASRRPHVRPLKIGPLKGDLEHTKADGQNGDVGVMTPTTPQTPPRRRPPKLGRPKAELEIMKLTKDGNETRSATSDGPGHARSPKLEETKAAGMLNEGRDQGATPEGPRRRPPIHGNPKAGTVSRVFKFNSAKAETSTPHTKVRGAKAKTSTPTVGLMSVRIEESSTTPKIDTVQSEPYTTAPEPKNDQAKAKIIPGPEGAQAEADIMIPKPNSAEAKTGVAPPESNRARAETIGTASNLSKAPELEIGEDGGAIPGQPRPRPRKLGRPKAETEPQGYNVKVEISAATPEPDSVPEETSATAPTLGKPPEIGVGVAGESILDGQRPMPKPPKLGRPKTELGSQKPEKLAKKNEKSEPEKQDTEHLKLGNTQKDPGQLATKDEKSTPEKPYIENPKLGNINADTESQETKSDQAAKNTEREPIDAMAEGLSPRAERKSNHENDTTPPTLRKRPAKLEKSKAELESRKSNKVAKKKKGARRSTLAKPAKVETESGEIKSEQAPMETDKEIKGIALPLRPQLKPPAPEANRNGNHDEDKTIPAGRARAPKLGRPKVEQERTKAERESTVASQGAKREET